MDVGIGAQIFQTESGNAAGGEWKGGWMQTVPVGEPTGSSGLVRGESALAVLGLIVRRVIGCGLRGKEWRGRTVERACVGERSEYDWELTELISAAKPTFLKRGG